MNKTTNRQTTSARGLLAALIIALALAFAAIPSLVLAADADDEFTDAASDIAIEEDSPDDDVTEPDQSPEPDADAPDPEPNPEPTSYSLRLIVSADDDALREGDTILGSHDGVHLLGFADEDALAEAETYYAEAAAWSDRDIPLVAADDESSEGAPEPVTADDNAIALLDAASADDMPTAEGGTTPLVALIDTGAPDDPAIVASATFVGDDPADRHGHATAMLEVMKAENSDVRVLAIKALGDDGEGSASSVYAAIEYATEQGADIINLSLAGYANDENAAIAEAVARALENGITVIAAAGNGGYDAAYFTPANIAGVFAVGACNEDGNVLDASNRGDCVSGYAVAGSTSEAAARLTGWASASGDRDLVESPFLFAPDDASYDGANAPGPDSDGSLSAAAKYSGVLYIYPKAFTYGITQDIKAGSVSWNFAGGTHSTNSVTSPYEKLYFYPYYTYPGISTGSAYSDGSSYNAKRVTSINVKPAWSGYFRGVFRSNGAEPVSRYGVENQLISATGALKPSLLKGSLEECGEAVFLFDKYNILVELDPDAPNVYNAGDAAVFVKIGDGVYYSHASTIVPWGLTKKLNPDGVGDSVADRVTIPKRNDGYSFDGYYTGRNGTGTQCIDYTGHIPQGQTSLAIANVLTGAGWDTKLYASWIRDAYVTLDNQGATVAGTEKLYVARGKFIYNGPDNSYLLLGSGRYGITVPQKYGYEFGGYYTGKNGSGIQVIGPNGYTTNTSPIMTANDTTLYAKWVEHGYITLDQTGATSNGTQKLAIVENQKILNGPNESFAEMTASSNPIAVPTRSGFSFGGYYSGSDGAGTLMITSAGYRTASLTPSAAGSTLYAKWVKDAPKTYVTWFDDTEGSGGAVALYMTVYNDSIVGNVSSKYVTFNNQLVPGSENDFKREYSLGRNSAPSIGQPSKKRFEGYFLPNGARLASGSNGRITLNEFATNEGFYESYTTNQITFEFYFPDWSKYTGTDAATYALNQQTYLDEYLLSYARTFSRVVENVTASDPYYAEARQPLDYNGWGDLPIKKLVIKNSYLPGPAYSYASTGYAFKPFVFTNAASWGKVARNFNVRGCTVCTYSGRSIRTGLAEDAWIGVPEAGRAYYASGVSVTSTVSFTAENRTATARWSGWPVFLDAQGGTSTGSSLFYEVYGDALYSDGSATSKVESLPVPTKTGYSFNGWYQQTGGEGLCVAGADGTITAEPAAAYARKDTTWCNEAGVKYAYADWHANTYKITLDPQGAENTDSGTRALYEVYDTGVFLSEEDAANADPATAMSATERPIAVPTRDGYVFKGYYSEPAGGTKYVDGDGHITAAFTNNAFSDDTTLYAQWIDPRMVLPLAGGFAESMPLMWGSALAVVGASGFVLFRTCLWQEFCRHVGMPESTLWHRV